MNNSNIYYLIEKIVCEIVNLGDVLIYMYK